MAAVDIKGNLDKSGMQLLTAEDIAGIDLTKQPSVLFHQQIRSDVGNERYTQALGFPSGTALGQDNQIYLPSMPMIVDELCVEFLMSAAGTSTNPYWVASYKWISNSGVRLLYKNSVVYSASQAEVEAMFFLNNSNKQLQDKLISHHDDPDGGTDTAAVYVYLDLSVLAKIMKHLGPLTSYDANSFQVQIGLKAAAGCISGSAGSAGTGSITSAQLLLTGFRSTPEYAQKLREKLNTSGLLVHYLQSNWQADAMADNGNSAATYNITLNQIEGNVACVLHLIRLTSVINSATPAGLGPVGAQLTGYLIFNDVADTYRLGTSSNPDLYFGKPMICTSVQELLGQSDRTFYGSTKVLNCAGLADTLAHSRTDVDNSGIRRGIAIYGASMCDRFSDDYIEGTSSGSMYFKNDMAAQFNITTDTVAARQVDTLVFVRRYCVIRSDGIFSNNSY